MRLDVSDFRTMDDNRYCTGTNSVRNYLFLIAACAALRRAIGTRNGEQDT